MKEKEEKSRKFPRSTVVLVEHVVYDGDDSKEYYVVRSPKDGSIGGVFTDAFELVTFLADF